MVTDVPLAVRAAAVSDRSDDEVGRLVSVVGVAGRRRWLAVAAGIAVLVAAPTVVPTAVGAIDALNAAPAPTARALLASALRSETVPFQGLAQSRGSLGLPDLPGFGELASLLGQTTRLRAWWASPTAWRVDTITTTGETGTYGVGDLVVAWDYERRELATSLAAVPVRLPRADDLLPPQATRRLLGSLGPKDEIGGLGAKRVAGRLAHGVRIRPGDPRSTLSRVEVWIDGSGLPLELSAFAADGSAALVSRFLDLRLTDPDAGVLTPPSPPGVEMNQTSDPGIERLLLRPGEGVLPDTLAGLPLSTVALGGGATYGRGLVRVTVLPVPHRASERLFREARKAGATDLTMPRGEAILTTTTMLNAALARGQHREQAYLITGLVTSALLEQAAAALVTDPVAEGTA